MTGSLSGSTVGFAADLAHAGSAGLLASTAVSSFGSLDIWTNNAGIPGEMCTKTPAKGIRCEDV
jgi:NAD(P)-dependent dehydrogenase (short-subunit alcohol dehydrogenase family)